MANRLRMLINKPFDCNAISRYNRARPQLNSPRLIPNICRSQLEDRGSSTGRDQAAFSPSLLPSPPYLICFHFPPNLAVCFHLFACFSEDFLLRSTAPGEICLGSNWQLATGLDQLLGSGFRGQQLLLQIVRRIYQN